MGFCKDEWAFLLKTNEQTKSKPPQQQQLKKSPQNCSFDHTGQMKSHGDGNKELQQVRQVEAEVIRRSVEQLVIASAG